MVLLVSVEINTEFRRNYETQRITLSRSDRFSLGAYFRVPTGTGLENYMEGDMSNEEILIKAIHKAVANGWKSTLEHWGAIDKVELSMANGMGWVWYEAGDGEQFNAYAILFSHSFAKAFWGEEGISLITQGSLNIDVVEHMPAWKMNLKIMVLEEDPIKYLEEFI